MWFGVYCLCRGDCGKKQIVLELEMSANFCKCVLWFTFADESVYWYDVCVEARTQVLEKRNITICTNTSYSIICK